MAHLEITFVVVVNFVVVVVHIVIVVVVIVVGDDWNRIKNQNSGT